MTATAIATGTTDAIRCTRDAAVTRSLLGYGVLAGPLYVTVGFAQALTRDGFDLTRHSWSILANGAWGWVQSVSFLVTGLMTVAAAVGIRRALGTGLGATWAPRLLAVFGACTAAEAFLRADPALGFPAGTPVDAMEVSPLGAAHLAVGAVGFLSLIAAAFVLARRFRAEGRRGWAVASAGTAAAFLGSFVGISAGAGSRPTVVAFVAGVVIAYGWLAALSLHLYRRAA
jgi:hypothetical protein